VLDEANVGHLAWLGGERHDVPDILRSLDCFVLPSRSEGICNTILEAMATGLPIVATGVGGNPELVVDGQSGTIVPPADSVALARAFLRYFEQPTLARQHGSAARHRAERHFSLESMVDAYDGLYWRLLYGSRIGREQALQSAPQEPA
jgi:glycosyltransferase involved in cell wall biosynthesis